MRFSLWSQKMEMNRKEKKPLKGAEIFVMSVGRRHGIDVHAT